MTITVGCSISTDVAVVLTFKRISHIASLARNANSLFGDSELRRNSVRRPTSFNSNGNLEMPLLRCGNRNV